MTQTDFDRDARLRFLDITPDTQSAMREVWPLIQPALPDILQDFYVHVTAIPALAEKIGGEGNITRLKAAQSKHWAGLFGGNFDAGYFDRCHVIGMTHFRIKLEPRWYMAGYSFVVARLTAILTEADRRKLQQAARAIAAMTKAIFLDMDVAISIYYEAMSAEQGKLGDKAKAFAKEVELLIGDLGDLGDAAGQLQDTTRAMNANADLGAGQSTAVAAAAKQANANVQIVASATEEFSASLGEVSSQVSESASIAKQASRQASDTKTHNLGDGSRANRGGKSWAERYAASGMNDKLRDLGNVPTEAHHPLVRIHDETGRRALYIGSHTHSMEGFETAEAAPLLGYLREHAVRPEFTCRFAWRPGSMATWDNRYVQYQALTDYTERRRMHHVTIAGEA